MILLDELFVMRNVKLHDINKRAFNQQHFFIIDLSSLDRLLNNLQIFLAYYICDIGAQRETLCSEGR